MFALVYRSRATLPFNDHSLHALARQAAEFNKQHQISGFLQFEQDHFLQYLEGEKASLENLMDKIGQDSRHVILRRIDLPEVTERTFEDWNMLYIPDQKFQILNLVLLLDDVLSSIHEEHYGATYIEQRVLRLIKAMSQHPKQYFEQDSQALE